MPRAIPKPNTLKNVKFTDCEGVQVTLTGGSLFSAIMFMCRSLSAYPRLRVAARVLQDDWMLIDKEFLANPPEWFIDSKPLWITDGEQVFIGHYKWVSANKPERLITGKGELWALDNCRVLPFVAPLPPKSKEGTPCALKK